MKKLKKFFCLALCATTAVCASACDARLTHPLSEWDWNLYFLRFGFVTNVTSVEYRENYDLKGNLCNIDKHYVFVEDNNHWMTYANEQIRGVRIDKEFWRYQQDLNEKWTKEETSDFYGNSNPLGVLIAMVKSFQDFYKCLTYDETLGYYKGENFKIESNVVQPTMVYAMEVEFKDAQVYRLYCEAERYTTTSNEAMKLEGITKTTMYLSDYGITKLHLPEVTE